jgi:hypothetical protein
VGKQVNIERLKNLVRGILDPREAVEAMRILSDSKTYAELQQEVVKLKKQLEEEMADHAAMENALARARLRAEGERDVALLASNRISEEEFLKRVDARWYGREDIPDDALNPVGKMLMGMRKKLKEVKPESQAQAEILADMHRVNEASKGKTEMDHNLQMAFRIVINNAAHRHKVFNQMNAILEKK